jgi:hypothetical protein
MQQLRQNGRVEIHRALLDHAQPEMDVPEQPSLLGLGKRWSRPQLARAADVVQKSRREEEVVP